MCSWLLSLTLAATSSDAPTSSKESGLWVLCICDLRNHFNSLRFTEAEKLYAAMPCLPAQFLTDAKAALQPVVDYFRARFDRLNCSFEIELGLFEAANLALPSRFLAFYGDGSGESRAKIKELVQRLNVYKQDEESVEKLMQEASLYAATAADEPFRGDRLEEQLDWLILWWQNHLSSSAWRKFAHRAFLLQPSSASVQRAFSCLNSSFGETPAGILVCKNSMVSM